MYHGGVVSSDVLNHSSPSEQAGLEQASLFAGRWSRGLGVAVVFIFLLERLLWMVRAPLSGDEAVFGLMSMAIGRGEAYPLYCWGAHYASALVSYMAIPVMALLGATPFAFRSTVLIWGMAQILLINAFVGRRFGAGPAILASLAVALPLPQVFIYSMMAHGGYPETYFLGTAIWVVALDVRERPSRFSYGMLGFLMGLSFAILWLGLPFLISALALLAVRDRLRRRESYDLVGWFFIGSLPLWIYNIFISPGATFFRLGARSLEATARVAPLDAVLGRIGHFSTWMHESAVGVSLLFSPVGGLVGAAVLIGLAVWGAFRLVRAGRDEGVLVLAFFGALLLFNIAGNLTRDRQWTPLWFALLLGWLGLGRRAAMVLLTLVIVLNLQATTTLIQKTVPDLRPLQIARGLERENADALIADYDLGYAVAFQALGRIPIAAVAPPNPSDRRPDWTARIRSARRPAILLPRDLGLDASRALVARGAGFTVITIEDRELIVTDAGGGAALDIVGRLPKK